MLEVGQGLAVVVQRRTHAFQGYPELDLLMTSHGDADHAVGKVWVASSVTAPAPHVFCQRGQHWQWDGVWFAVVHPGLEAEDSNNQSCVLQVSASHGNALLLGDVEKRVERELAASGRSVAPRQ